MVAEGEELAFTLYHASKVFDKEKAGYLPITRFNKIIYLVHNELKKEKDIDIKLPWYWYRYGPIVSIDHCPSYVIDIVEINRERRNVYYRKEPKTRSLSGDEKEIILSIIDKYYHQWLGIPSAIDEAYDRLERPFFKIFLTFEEYLKFIQAKGTSADNVEGKILRYINDLTVNFPEAEFPSLLHLYLRLDDIIRIIVIDNYDYLISTIPFIIGFRELIVTNAQFVYYENMPEDWLDEKRIVFANLRTQYSRQMESIERDVFSNIYIPKNDDSQYSKKLMNLSARMSEEE